MGSALAVEIRKYRNRDGLLDADFVVTTEYDAHDGLHHRPFKLLTEAEEQSAERCD